MGLSNPLTCNEHVDSRFVQVQPEKLAILLHVQQTINYQIGGHSLPSSSSFGRDPLQRSVEAELTEEPRILHAKAFGVDNFDLLRSRVVSNGPERKVGQEG
jgi:hypothetical protein